LFTTGFHFLADVPRLVSTEIDLEVKVLLQKRNKTSSFKETNSSATVVVNNFVSSRLCPSVLQNIRQVEGKLLFQEQGVPCRMCDTAELEICTAYFANTSIFLFDMLLSAYVHLRSHSSFVLFI
jgi:hypothetical protein